MNDWPTWANLMIAIAPYGGWSQDDSIIRKRRSRLWSVYRVFKATCRKRGSNDVELFEHPLWRDSNALPKCEGLRGRVNYDKTDSTDFLKRGRLFVMEKSSLAASLTLPGSEETRVIRRDRSVVLTCEALEVFYADKVMVSITKELEALVSSCAACGYRKRRQDFQQAWTKS